MKTNNRFLGLSLSLLTLTVLFAACAASTSDTDASDAGGGGGGGATATPTPTPTPKAIINTWTSITGAAVVLDLTNAVLDGSTSFSAPLNGYSSSICTYTLKMGATQGVSGNCTVVGSPVLTAAGTGAFFGASGVDCTTNSFNICDEGTTNEYLWNGTGLSFPNNGYQFR